MRTTVDIPDALLKKAKIAAVERGITLRDLVRTALVREVDHSASESPVERRARFPIFGSSRPGALRMTPERLTRFEAEEEARRNGVGT